MAQSWHDLLFAHWPVPAHRLRTLIHPALTLDTFDAQAWLGVVPFRMTGVRPRFVPPVPGLSAFAELNVRTYVVAGGKPGVVFFSLDAANGLAVTLARRFFYLPYFHARMSCAAEGDAIRYASRRTHQGAPGAELRGRYGPTGPVALAVPGSLEHWLTERYCLYAEDPRGGLHRCEIHHDPWPLQPAQAEIEVNTMADPVGIPLAGPPLLHFARRLDVVVWWLQALAGAEGR
jgi:uncharacterized protein YqjF (DUF2071 family)